MPKISTQKPSICVIYIDKTDEILLLIQDGRTCEFRVPIPIWRSVYLRLSMLRNARFPGHVCTHIGRGSDERQENHDKANQAVHIAYSDCKIWITLHSVHSRKLHKQKTLEFARPDELETLLTLSRHAFLEASAFHYEHKREARRKLRTAMVASVDDIVTAPAKKAKVSRNAFWICLQPYLSAGERRSCEKPNTGGK